MGNKRLVLFLDGTWKTAEDDGRSTNVVKMMRAVAPRDAGGVEQIVYYNKGVGTGGLFDRLRGGGTGQGLDANIKAAYIFLGNNYEKGDEVFLFGFSRGAYTARSLAGFVGKCGLLDRVSMSNLAKAWQLYRKRDRTSDDDKAIEALAGRKIPIECIGVWDTVGALGIPVRGILLRPFRRKHAFHDMRLGERVRHAFHATAVDEKRGAFRPALWERGPDDPPRPQQVVEQVWFAGVHSDVGGGYNSGETDAVPHLECGLSDLTLEWMVDRVGRHTKLLFRSDWREVANGNGPRVQGQPLGVMHESRSLFYTLMLDRLRPHHRVVAGHGRRGPRRMEPINERIHASVLERIGHVLPVRDHGRLRMRRYEPRNVAAGASKPGTKIPLPE